MRTMAAERSEDFQIRPQPKLQMPLQMTRHPRKGLPPVELDFTIS